MLTLLLRHLRDEVLENLPALSRNQWLAHSHSSSRLAASTSTKAVNFSSARAQPNVPLLRCASAIQIVRPLESMAETQPQLHPALLRLSAIISQLRFTPDNYASFALHTAMTKWYEKVRAIFSRKILCNPYDPSPPLVEQSQHLFCRISNITWPNKRHCRGSPR